MTQIIGRNRNTNDEADVPDPIVLNITTSVVIAAANPKRTFIRIDNDSNDHGVWVKLQAASVDNTMKGIYLSKKQFGVTFWEMGFDNIYTGEICAVSETGTPQVYITEY